MVLLAAGEVLVFGWERNEPLLRRMYIATLIFLKGDYSFYGLGILDLIRRGHVEDDRYPRLTVYRRREPVGP